MGADICLERFGGRRCSRFLKGFMVGIWTPETRVQIKGVWKLKVMTGSVLQGEAGG